MLRAGHYSRTGVSGGRGGGGGGFPISDFIRLAGMLVFRRAYYQKDICI